MLPPNPLPRAQHYKQKDLSLSTGKAKSLIMSRDACFISY